MMKLKNKSLIKSAGSDFILSVLALVIYNGVLQLLIYPGLETRIGAEAFGTVLYLISAVSIMGAGFGTAASYSRMVARKERSEKNGDYNFFLLLISLLSIPVTLLALFAVHEPAGARISEALTVWALMVVTVARYYADVEYRMNIRFRDYLLFFFFVSAGYVIGLLIYPFTESWVFTIFLGEVSGILYTIIRGSIFRAPFFEKSKDFKENLKSLFYISASNLLGALILHSDRILIRLMIGGREVTVFYAAGLIGKIVALLTTPLNGVIISYLTNYNIKFYKKRFGLLALSALLLCVIGAFVCSGVSIVFVKIMYPDIFEEARNFFYLANLGQMLYFVSGSLMVVILSFTREKLQTLISVVYAALFCLFAIPLAFLFGLWGFAIGVILANLARFFIVVAAGLKKLD